jgi:hypothetical protein
MKKLKSKEYYCTECGVPIDDEIITCSCGNMYCFEDRNMVSTCYVCGDSFCFDCLVECGKCGVLLCKKCRKTFITPKRKLKRFYCTECNKIS